MKYNIFRDRAEAGQLLAQRLGVYVSRPHVLVLGLPRGGVPVAYEVAIHIHAPLDVLIVRKLGVPGREELAFGALASGGTRVLDQDILRLEGITAGTVETVTDREQREVERRDRLYRNGRPFPDVKDMTVILVDDGMATGSTMQAGVEALRQRKPEHLIVAIPVASPESVSRLRRVADEVVCLYTPELFYALGLWYADFSQTTDDEVRDLLASSQSVVEHLAG